MSYGTVTSFKTKKAFAEAVARRGAENVHIFGTSVFGNEKATTVSELADTSAVIVGPDVEHDRRWYANVKTNKRTGKIEIK